MGQQVVVLASGETERRALPHLVAHLQTEEITLLGVVYPPNHRDLDVIMAERLIKAAWYGRDYTQEPPDRFVVLVDLDGGSPEEVLAPFRADLPHRVTDVEAQIVIASAQWHLEAWFFADAAALRVYLGRDLGSIDTSKPDEIENPKLHLKHLLETTRLYTSVIAEEIAQVVNAQTIAQRSPSFQGFLNAMRGT